MIMGLREYDQMCVGCIYYDDYHCHCFIEMDGGKCLFAISEDEEDR